MMLDGINAILGMCDLKLFALPSSLPERQANIPVLVNHESGY